jgi:hypothetical protein
LGMRVGLGMRDQLPAGHGGKAELARPGSPRRAREARDAFGFATLERSAEKFGAGETARAGSETHPTRGISISAPRSGSRLSSSRGLRVRSARPWHEPGRAGLWTAGMLGRPEPASHAVFPRDPDRTRVRDLAMPEPHPIPTTDASGAPLVRLDASAIARS